MKSKANAPKYVVYFLDSIKTFNLGVKRIRLDGGPEFNHGKARG